MKKALAIIIMLGLLGSAIYFREEIINFIVKNITSINNEPTKLVNNSFSRKDNFKLVQITDNFKVKNIQDIENVYYTIFNSGTESFTFYCDSSYENCIEDVNYISNNQKLLSHINNFVPVFNTFKNVETEFDNLGRVTVNIILTYNNDIIINALNNKINEVIKEKINDNQTTEEKIKIIHDYIINNAKYDSNRSDKKIAKYHSDIAYGPLLEGYAICGGYADAMKLFLDKLDIPNFKISSENHVWNAVYVNGKWLHLDLTWDDPVTTSGDDVLEYDYFLITNEELANLEHEQHNFDKEIYLELNEKDA